jgi:replicative DNA helicase
VNPSETGFLPPQEPEAEASLLGSILLDGESISQVADVVSPADFYDPAHGQIYASMLSLYEKHKPIDLLTLTNELKRKKQLDKIGGASYLTELTNRVPTASHVEHYGEIVAEAATRRRLIKAAASITTLGYDEDKAIGLTLAEAEADLFAVSQATAGQDLLSIEAILSQSFDRLDELHKDKSRLRGVPTGFKALDNLLAGLQPSDLIVLASRPSMGKSTLAMNIAHHVALEQKRSVLVFSLEMSKEQLVDRLLAAEAGIDAWNSKPLPANSTYQCWRSAS